MKKLELYSARYCGKCRALKRRLSDLKKELIDVDLIIHDIDIERAKAKANKIDGVPALIYYINNKEVARMSGSIYEEDILSLIAKE
ncbi:MAG: thioredoxin family protein [Candidatus Izemoplasmatales bacterium]|nr:thioredoxin family protein [Candidatus Izemoplasmatales bacterium]MDY0139588.1 thioredoxin family protein [Candidatus Izemoplasmatales bacterium]